MSLALVFIASPGTYNGIGVCSAPIGFNVSENFMHKIKSDISVSVMSYKLLFYFIQEQFIYVKKKITLIARGIKVIMKHQTT